MTDQAARTAPGQWRSLLSAAHLKQALAVAVVVGALVALMGRPAREVGISALAVLVSQLILGLVNDVCDVELDRASGAPGKPIAQGHLPQGNATFAIAVLSLLVIPLSLQNGWLAGLLLLATLPVGVVHDRWLHRTALSWVGWAATFALLAGFVTWGGWGQEADGSAPYPTFVVLAAALGVVVHFLTSLPDLVQDNMSRVRHLPLRVALRTGAPRLLVISIVAAVLVVGALVYTALAVGIAA
jgi:4-hydroxybenzoate polyprenyltransferase